MNHLRTAFEHIVKKLLVLHPFLFALFPILAVYGYNMQELSPSDLILPLVVALGSTIALFFLSLLFLRNGNKSGLVVSIFVLLFYSYGGIRLLLAPRLPWDPDMLLLPLWALLLTLCVVLIARIRWNMRKLTIILNAAAAVMILIPAVRVGVGETRRLASGSERELAPMNLQLHAPDHPLDIYYIILDEYAGSEHLLDTYGYDNGAFVDYLSDRGFYVASASRSNYSRTWLSLPSSLNMDYMSNLVPQRALASQYWFPLSELVVNNRVAALLKSAGYEYVSFNTCEELTWRSPSADMSIDASGSSLSPFQRVLVQYSLASVVWHDSVNYREHILKSFDELSRMPAIGGPKFVFAHITCPHWPYVFDAEGKPIHVVDWRHEKNRSEKYLDQITFVNKKVELLVDQILSSSPTPPIIILQGDHGPRFVKSGDKENPTAASVQDAHMILNALYLPYGGDRLMYESISPVNTFRVVFNYYFGSDLPLLKDESYLSVSGSLFPVVNVTDKLEQPPLPR